MTTAGAIAIQAAAGTGLETETMKEMMIEEAGEGGNGAEAMTRGGIGSLAGPATGPEVGHTVKGEGGAESALMRGLRGGVGGPDPLRLRAPTRGPRLLRHPNQRKRKRKRKTQSNLRHPLHPQENKKKKTVTQKTVKSSAALQTKRQQQRKLLKRRRSSTRCLRRRRAVTGRTRRRPQGLGSRPTPRGPWSTGTRSERDSALRNSNSSSSRSNIYLTWDRISFTYLSLTSDI